MWKLRPRVVFPWKGSRERWPASMRAGYRGEGNAFALRLAPWPTVQRLPQCLLRPNIFICSSLKKSGWSACQNKDIGILTASSAVEGQLWHKHNVVALDSPGRMSVISEHAAFGAAFDTRKSCHGSVWLFQYKKKEIDFVVRYKLYHSLPIQFLKGGQKHFEEIKWHRNNLPACIHYTMPNCISCALGLQHCDLLASS